MNLGLDGTVALITGGGGGLGRAVSVELAREGAHVIVLDVRSTAAEATAEAITDSGGEALPLVCDVADADARAAALRAAIAWRGAPTAVCLNAGVGGYGTIESLLVEEWRRIMAINLDANLHILRTLLSPMRAAGGGSIVAVSSPGAAAAGHPSSSAAYGVSKAGLERLMTDVADRHRADRIRANSVRPGPLDTDFVAHRLPGDGTHAARPPIGARLAPEAIAGPIAFLLSARAMSITGQTVSLDGVPPDL